MRARGESFGAGLCGRHRQILVRNRERNGPQGGYLPIDKTGTDLLFQILSQRYERGSTVITTNRVYGKWPEIFNNDATLTSAVLDRLLNHAETVVIEGKSFRMKDANTDS